MLDRYNRRINYLRISVTDRCDLRCVYCVPQKCFVQKKREDILSYEQIEEFVKEAAKLGITKVRLTGGEPLMRRGIDNLVGSLSRIKGVNELCMTTNGTHLSEMAGKLKRNGLDRVNISIDSLDPNRYKEITGGGELKNVLEGVNATLDAGLTPIKINMVILETTTEAEVQRMKKFCEEKGLRLQKIMQFSLYDRHDLRMRFHAERPPECAYCNRLRLTADGFLKPCLFSEDEIKVYCDDIRGTILDAVAAKPEAGSSCRNRLMHEIGG